MSNKTKLTISKLKEIHRIKFKTITAMTKEVLPYMN